MSSAHGEHEKRVLHNAQQPRTGLARKRMYAHLRIFVRDCEYQDALFHWQGLY